MMTAKEETVYYLQILRRKGHSMACQATRGSIWVSQEAEGEKGKLWTRAFNLGF